MMRTSLFTDHYELTMLEGALRSGIASRKAVFEVFARELPKGRRYGVLGGTGRLIEALERFSFGEEELHALERAGALGRESKAYLSSYRFSGDVYGYMEGETYGPGSPVLTVVGSFGEALVLETLVLSILNFDSAIAAAAARIVSAAKGRTLLEMGSRRTHEEAAVAAARMAWICGFDATSNLECSRRYGIPTAGTVSHAFILAHDNEDQAFRAQVEALGAKTTILVDTYDMESAIKTAVSVTGAELGAIRIDSGDLGERARTARKLLDTLGAHSTRIVVSGELDEHAIAGLLEAPVDAFGVGYRLVTGSGYPSAGFVYKLVAIEDDTGKAMRPVAKTSPEKGNIPGAKRAWRLLDGEGLAIGDAVTSISAMGSIEELEMRSEGSSFAARETDGPWRQVAPPEAMSARSLQHTYIQQGLHKTPASPAEARTHHAKAKEELRPSALELSPGEPSFGFFAASHENAR